MERGSRRYTGTTFEKNRRPGKEIIGKGDRVPEKRKRKSEKSGRVTEKNRKGHENNQ